MRKLFIDTPLPSRKTELLGDQKAGRPRVLRDEGACLALIFFNLIFIHLQTSRILISHRLATGINISYFMMLVLVLVIRVPYYHIRRQILFRDRF